MESADAYKFQLFLSVSQLPIQFYPQILILKKTFIMKIRQFIIIILTIALHLRMHAQYDAIVVKLDYCDYANPKYRQHIDMAKDITNGYLLIVSTEKTTINEGATKISGDITKKSNCFRSKISTDTVINLTEEVFNELAGECFRAAAKYITEKMGTNTYEIYHRSNSMISLSVSNGPIAMEFLFGCPLCTQNNCYEEQFRDILEKILTTGGLDSKKILGD